MTHWRPGQLAKAIALVWLLLLLSGSQQAAQALEQSAPEASLARLAPADAGLCLESDRLGEHAARFVAGPLFQRLKRFPPLAKWVAQNGALVGQYRAEFQRRLGVPPNKVWSGIFGGRTLFAVWPAAEEGASGPVLVVVEAPDGELLEQAIARIVALHADSGKRQTSVSLHAGEQECLVHILNSHDNREQWRLTKVGGLGIAANREELIRGALALYGGAEGAPESLADLSGYVAGNLRLSPNVALRLFINPRPWDEGLLADLKRKPPESDDARAQKAVIDAWRATEYVIAGLQLDSQARLESYAAWNAAALPQPVRDAVESLSGPAELVARIPSNALAAIAGRVDLGRLVSQFGLRGAASSESSGAGKQTGLPAIKPEWLIPATFAHGLGPNYGAYLAPSSTNDEETGSVARQLPLPLDWAAALATRPLEPGDQRPPLAELAEPVLHSALSAARAASEAQSKQSSLRVKTLELGGTRMTSIAGLPIAQGGVLDFTYAVENARFWLASSPAAIRRSLDLAPEASLASLPQLQDLKAPSQLVYLNLRSIRETLQSSPSIVDFLAAHQGLDRDAAKRSCRELLALGELADIAVLAVRLDESGPAVLLSISAEGDATTSSTEPPAQ